jgi:ATP-dependent DNA ligase
LVEALARIRAVQCIERDGKALFEAVVRIGAEGIVAKRLASTYPRGRTRDWLKIKTEAGVKKTEERGDSWYGGPSEETKAKRATREAAKAQARRARPAGW